ncbi:DUF167 domain-containing protein [Thalassobaculum sp.]|uniref:DUF167 domain-containing protein n=1 Tax=Thalassobaculum sp. TaxID=2022740 RepID=UPI0032ECB4E3
MPTPTPFHAGPDGVRVALKVMPKAAADRVRGVVQDEAGVAWLQVSVTAVPEDGRANRAVTALLAKRWRVPKSSIEIVQGATDRRKVLLVHSDDTAALTTRLETWLTSEGTSA